MTCVRDSITACSAASRARDTIGYKGMDENLYRYVRNQPVDHTDPYGTDCPGCDGISAFLDYSPCFLQCCAIHDMCYDKYNCTDASWRHPFKSWQCDSCNASVMICLGACRLDPTPWPAIPKYYCKKQHTGISI